MNSNARDKIFKSWSGVSEVALIKEVATKGEHIELCIEYWSKKRKIVPSEYRYFFHDVVQTYVHRLLTERLVCKAETVLLNVNRNVKCFYYQFACESADEELRDMVLEHLSRKDAHSFAQDMQELQFHWELLQSLQQCPAVLERCKTQLRRVNLETILARDDAFIKRLMVEVYFELRNPHILARLNKYVIWTFLVDQQQTQQLVRWCTLSALGTTAVNQYATDLELKYCQWSVETEMFEQGLKSLKQPDEALRNSFAQQGHFFADERLQVAVVLRRMCTTGSFAQCKELLAKLPLGEFLLKRGLHMLLLRDFVSSRELEELAETRPEQSKLLEFIVAVKDNDLQERQGFEKIARCAQVYLESQGVDFSNEQTLVPFFDFLCNEPTVSTLSCFLPTSALSSVPYLKSLSHRLENANKTPLAANNIPTPYDFLRKFKQLDFKQITCKDNNNEVASFSNQRLCEKYGRKYQLNFLHYLKQQRSCYAVYYLLTSQLQHYAQLTQTQLYSASETVTELALQHASNSELLTHCIAFNEMLGFDTQNLRSFLKLQRLLGSSASHYGQLITGCEVLLVERLQQQPEYFPLADYQALMRIVACNQYKQWPALILQQYARRDDWWRLLVLLQYFDVPLSQLQCLIEHFKTRSVGEHLLRALSHEAAAAGNDRGSSAKRHASISRQQQLPSTTSGDTMTSSMSSCNDAAAHFKRSKNSHQRFFIDATGNLDLFAIILLSTTAIPEERLHSGDKFLQLMQDQNSYATSLNLMKHSLRYRRPVLCLLAATVTSANVDWNWLVWLAVASDQWSTVQRLCAAQRLHELAWTMIEQCVYAGQLSTVHRSFCIFYEQHPLTHLTRFLHETAQRNNFSDSSITELRLYLLAWSNEEIELPLCPLIAREELMLLSIKLLLLHLQRSFASAYDQRKMLQSICRSGISDISGMLDFCLLNEVFGILQSGSAHTIRLDFAQLLFDAPHQYEQLIAALLAAQHYDLATQLATLLQLPISDIVYSKWVAGVENDDTLQSSLCFDSYELEIREHSLPPQLLVNFLLYAAGRLPEPCARKYQLLQQALNVIKQHHLFPNECFDRDQIEYEMVLCYLQLPTKDAEPLPLYHSEYFEQIMLQERCVLYKSFLELKELAGIEDLSVSLKTPLTPPMQLLLEELLNRLLDEGDIVEALRLQELFEQRPIDLRFIVFCMALAEGVTTIFSMSPEERQLLREVERSAFAKFNKRTLGTLRSSAQSSPIKLNNDLSDSCSTLEFEEIPSKEKRETLDTIQGIASRLKYGISLGSRIVMVYRAAMYLDMEYLDVLRTKDATMLLKSVAEDGCLHKLLVVSDIVNSTQMTADEIAELLSYEITTAIVRPRFYIFGGDQQARSTFKNADLWGYNIDRNLHLFLELTPNTTLLGNRLLDYCDALRAYRRFQDHKVYDHTQIFEKLSEIIARYGLPGSTTAGHVTPPTPNTAAQVLSHKKQNIICVELLIKAHQCFVHECSMEGIANVLNRAKALNSVLTSAKSWSLIVRMLSGIARYREMFYCFHSLIEHEQFESLLGQFDEEKTLCLRQAIIAYLREYRPTDGREYFKLAAMHFLMYKELAEMWEQDAKALVAKLLAAAQVAAAQLPEQNSMNSLSAVGGVAKTHIPKLRSSTEALRWLQETMDYYTHATENYLLDNKLLLAQRSVAQAELIAMQLDLASKALAAPAPHLCVCVINVQTRDEFRELINAELRVPQAIILGRAYGYDINWAEVVLSQYVIKERQQYLYEYLAHFPISDSIIDNMVKGFQLYAQSHKVSATMEEHVAGLIEYVKSITLKYKLASLLSMKSTVMALINEQTMYYLKDTDYGRNERPNMPDV